MIVQTDRYSPSETYRVASGPPASSAPATELQPSWMPSRAPQRADLVDGADFALAVDPPPSRWPRIFPSL